MTESSKKLGPNVKWLMSHKMSMDAIPSGTEDGLVAGIRFLTDKKRLLESARNAIAWAEEAIDMVRQAKGPNPWKHADDEAIAGEVLRRIEERKKQTRDAYRSKKG